MSKLSINNQGLSQYESIVPQVQKSLLLYIVLYVYSYRVLAKGISSITGIS